MRLGPTSVVCSRACVRLVECSRGSLVFQRQMIVITPMILLATKWKRCSCGIVQHILICHRRYPHIRVHIWISKKLSGSDCGGCDLGFREEMLKRRIILTKPMSLGPIQIRRVRTRKAGLKPRRRLRVQSLHLSWHVYFQGWFSPTIILV